MARRVRAQIMDRHPAEGAAAIGVAMWHDVVTGRSGRNRPGALIGQQYDGTTLPLAYAFLISGVVGLILVFWAERGKLFTRPGTAPKTPY